MAGRPLTYMFPNGVCQAIKKNGVPCKIRLAVYKCLNGKFRCKWHGGLSTGPRTKEGKAKVALNLPCVKAARLARARKNTENTS